MSSQHRCKILIDLFSNNMEIPNVIIDIILKYHGSHKSFLLLNMNLFILNSKNLYNIISKESYVMPNTILNNPHVLRHIVTKTSLPKFVANNIPSTGSSSKQLSSKKWSMIIKSPHKGWFSKLTAIHYDIDGHHEDILGIDLPKLRIPKNFGEQSLVYSKTNQVLYATNIHIKDSLHHDDRDTISSKCPTAVFSLNFNVCRYIPTCTNTNRVHIY